MNTSRLSCSFPQWAGPRNEQKASEKFKLSLLSNHSFQSVVHVPRFQTQTTQHVASAALSMRSLSARSPHGHSATGLRCWPSQRGLLGQETGQESNIPHAVQRQNRTAVPFDKFKSKSVCTARVAASHPAVRCLFPALCNLFILHV